MQTYCLNPCYLSTLFASREPASPLANMKRSCLEAGKEIKVQVRDDVSELEGIVVGDVG